MENAAGAVSSLSSASAETKPGAGYYAARVLAQILDHLIFGGIFYLVGMAVAVRMGGLVDGAGFNLTGLPALGVMGSVLLAAFAYDWLLEGLFGRTIGKMICNLKVVRATGEVCGLGPSLIRNLLRVVDGFFFYLVGFIAILVSKKQQRVGDLAAGTFVVKAKSTGVQILGIVLFLAFVGGAVAGGLMQSGVKPSGISAPPSSPSSVPSSSVPIGAGMSIQNLRFTEGKEGPPVSKSYGPRDELYLNFEAKGLTVDANNYADAYIRFEAVDPKGKPLIEALKVDVKGASPTKPAFAPANFHLTLPAFVEGGSYSVQITVHDNISGKEISQKVPFQVIGPQIPPGTPFGIRDYQFLSAKNGPPLADAAYAPGATVYSKFLAVGFQLGPQNSLKLRLDLNVVSKTGETLLEQKNIITVSDQFFYPPAYLSMNTSVNTPSSVPPGSYVIHYVLYDDVAGTQVTYDAPFTIK